MISPNSLNVDLVLTRFFFSSPSDKHSTRSFPVYHEQIGSIRNAAMIVIPPSLIAYGNARNPMPSTQLKILETALKSDELPVEFLSSIGTSCSSSVDDSASLD